MKKRDTAYLLRVTDEVASLVRGLHPLLKSHVRMALQAIMDDPWCGKMLKDELQGLRSFRVKKYRIIYRVARKKRELEIIAVGPRRNIYEETYRIIRREELKK